MHKVHICDRDLWQGFNGRGEESTEDVLRNPLAVVSCIGAPHTEPDDAEDGDEICWTFAVLQGEGLPEEETPAERQEHIASSSVEVCDGEAGGSGEWDEDGVDDGALEADGESVATKCVSGYIEKGGGEETTC